MLYILYLPIYLTIYLSVYLSLSLSLYIYIYIIPPCMLYYTSLGLPVFRMFLEACASAVRLCLGYQERLFFPGYRCGIIYNFPYCLT